MPGMADVSAAPKRPRTVWIVTAYLALYVVFLAADSAIRISEPDPRTFSVLEPLFAVLYTGATVGVFFGSPSSLTAAVVIGSLDAVWGLSAVRPDGPADSYGPLPGAVVVVLMFLPVVRRWCTKR